jgi:hypothetical protein
MYFKSCTLTKVLFFVLLLFTINQTKGQSINHLQFHNLQICDYNIDLNQEINPYNCQNSEFESNLYVNWDSKIVTVYIRDSKYTYYIAKAVTSKTGVVLDTKDIKENPTRIYIFSDGSVTIRNNKVLITLQ